MLTCSRPLMERRLRPQHDQALKCPRCDSTHTKFCYYNNYSLSQPRYFCKTCRRYWTKGGTLRNIPVGGGCRKNKKVSSKKSSNDNHHESVISDQNHHPGTNTSSSSLLSNNNPTDLQLSSFPHHHHEVQFSHHLNNLLLGSPNNFMMDSKYNSMMLENPAATIHDFMDNKFEALVGISSRNQQHDLLGNNAAADHHHHLGIMTTGLGGDMMSNNQQPAGMFAANYHNFCTPFGMSIDGNSGNIMDSSACQRLMLPYEAHHHQDPINDVKPNTKLLSLEWHDQQQQQGSCSDTGKDNFGYINGSVGPWPGLMNGYGSSTTNPLV